MDLQEKALSWRSCDKLMPSQMAMSCLFKGSPDELPMALEKVLNLGLKSVKEKFTIEEKPGVPYEAYGSSLHMLYFLQMLIRIGGYKRILEIGTFYGVSALMMQEIVGGVGVITIACHNTRNHPIGMLFSEGLNILTQLDRTFDLIVIDAAKEQYPDMLEPALKILQSGGLLVIDDVFFHGDALNDMPSTDKGRGCQGLMHMVMRLPYPHVTLPIGNGVILVFKQ